MFGLPPTSSPHVRLTAPTVAPGASMSSAFHVGMSPTPLCGMPLVAWYVAQRGRVGGAERAVLDEQRGDRRRPSARC